MPTDDASRMRSGALRQRPTGRRWISRDADRNASPPGRSRRFLMRLSKRRARAPTPTSETPDRSSVDLGCSQDWSSRDAARLDRSFHMDRLTPDRVTPDRLTPDRLTSGRRSLDNRRDTGATQTTTSSTRARTVYTVVDRNIPRHVLKGDAKFEDSTWNEYRDHIDELSEDPRFMDYLTAPVQRRPAVPTPAVDAHADSERIAVNKLYPLAFIRLLEAHAKYTAESYEPYNPEEEEHRYDDVDREDEGRVVRTTSTGVYDMGRFRAVGGSTPVSNASTPEGMMNRRDSPPAFGGLAPKSQTSSDMPQQPSFFQRISHERPSAIVPVC